METNEPLMAAETITDALRFGDIEAAAVGALRRAGAELALEQGGTLAQATFAAAYCAACHRQWVAGAYHPRDRAPFITAELLGDRLAQEAARQLGEDGCAAVETWIFDAWPEITTRGDTLHRAEESAAAGLFDSGRGPTGS